MQNNQNVASNSSFSKYRTKERNSTSSDDSENFKDIEILQFTGLNLLFEKSGKFVHLYTIFYMRRVGKYSKFWLLLQ